MLLCAVVSARTGLARESPECRAIAASLVTAIPDLFDVIAHGNGRVSIYISRGECQGIAGMKTRVVNGRGGIEFED